MKYDYPHLCSPITIAGKTFPHRMFSAPMAELISRTTDVSDRSPQHSMSFAQRAEQQLSPSASAWYTR